MKKNLLLICFVSLFCMVCSCGNNGANDSLNASINNIPSGESEYIYSPFDSNNISDMLYIQVEASFREAGFERITTNAIDDIDSSSDIRDGAVDSVIINSQKDFKQNDEFKKDAEVIIYYHNIPKINVPVSPAEASSRHYMDVGKTFFNAGFINIETDEIYDIAPGEASKTIILVNGNELQDETLLPFDAEIQVLEHFPISEFTTTIEIDFVPNLLFNKYNVVVKLDDSTLGTLDHGKDGTYNVSLPAGTYLLKFIDENDSTVTGEASFVVDSDTSVSCRISCENKYVKVNNTECIHSLVDNNLLMPYSSFHYLRKNYQVIVDELKALGFNNITAKETTDTLWIPDDVNTVVGIEIGGKSDFLHGELIDKATAINVYYHVADFSFKEKSITVTEKETFELEYSMTSGDLLKSITFEIDRPDVIQQNEDGSYSALIPGTATVTATSGGHMYSTCKVTVNEIIVPIDKLIFSDKEFDISVGSYFKPEYEISPSNANYTDIRTVISNDLIEETAEKTFYSNEAGDTEISFYQDDRLLGSCILHAVYVDIEEISLGEATTEIFVGDTIDMTFDLSPEKATNKGIVVSSSAPDIAEVFFDERGASAIKIEGKKAGKSEITITAPSGIKQAKEIVVKNVEPENIILSCSDPQMRIEVGSPIVIETKWAPENTTIKELTWTSDNQKVIKIDKDGNITAVGIGTAEITAKHKTGVSATITLSVEPTLVTGIEISTDLDTSKKTYPGDKFTITASILPENATDKTINYSSSNETVATVNNKGVVTAVGTGTATITCVSPDGPKKTVSVTVSPAPQKFKITWSASLSSNDHVGSNWSKGFEVNDESFKSGNTIVLDPDSSFTVRFWVEEDDSNPDVGIYYEQIQYTDDLCKNGYTISTSVGVRENGGRYSGCYAYWNLKITITPVK